MEIPAELFIDYGSAGFVRFCSRCIFAIIIMQTSIRAMPGVVRTVSTINHMYRVIDKYVERLMG